MKLTRKCATLAAILASFLVIAQSTMFAQALNSGPQNIAVTATLAESLSLNLSGNAVSFNLTAGSANNPGSTGITATTTWTLKPSRTAVKVYAYFAAAATALTDGSGNNIPSSAFFISDNAGPSAALVNTVPFGGALAGLQLSNTAITAANRSSSHNDAMTFNINLTALPQLPANPSPGYQGTLSIQAQATP